MYKHYKPKNFDELAGMLCKRLYKRDFAYIDIDLSDERITILPDIDREALMRDGDWRMTAFRAWIFDYDGKAIEVKEDCTPDDYDAIDFIESNSRSNFDLSIDVYVRFFEEKNQ